MAKPYEFMTNFGSKKYIINAYKEFLEHTSNNLNNEINMISDMSSQIMDMTLEAETLQDAIDGLPSDIGSLVDNSENQTLIKSEMGTSTRGLIAIGDFGYVDPVSYSKITTIHSLLDDFSDDINEETIKTQVAGLMTKMGLDSMLYPLSSVSGSAHQITSEDIVNMFDKDDPVKLMNDLKEAAITNTALGTIYDSYQGENVEEKQTLDIAGFKTRVEARLGCSIDDRLLNPAMQLLNTAMDCPNSSIFLTIFNKMLSFDEDTGYSEDFTPSNNDFSKYTGSAWTGFLGMAGSVATVIGNAIATTGKCLFNVIGGAFLAINALAFKVMGAVVGAITKFIYEIFDPIAIGIAKGNSATVEGFGIIGNSITFTLSQNSSSNEYYPLFTRWFPNAYCNCLFNKSRARKLVGKWVYIETFGLKGLYKIENYSMRDANYLNTITLSYMVKPVAYDIPTIKEMYRRSQQVGDGYGRWSFGPWTQQDMMDMSSWISNSAIQKLESQASGWNVENVLMTCIIWPFWQINSLCYAHLMRNVLCTSSTASVFKTEVMNNYGGAPQPTWDNAGAPILDPGKLLENIRHNSTDKNNSNLNNTDFVQIATGSVFQESKFNMWNWDGMYNSHPQTWRQVCMLPKIARFPIMPFLCFLNDLCEQPDDVFIPYTTQNIGDWGVEQITIKTDAQLATSSLMKVVALAAAITAVFVGPKIVGKIKGSVAKKLSSAYKLKDDLQAKMVNGTPLSLKEKRQLRRANKRISKANGVMSPVVTTQTVSLNNAEEAQEEMNENIENISSRLF